MMKNDENSKVRIMRIAMIVIILLMIIVISDIYRVYYLCFEPAMRQGARP